MKQLNTIISSLKSRQMSEAIINAVFLTLSGGFQDAYTYCCREEVFANAQTGNIVLMSSYIFQGKLYNAVRYLIPILEFITGIYLAQVIHRHFKYMKKIHWRQLIIAAEISLLLTVGFIPNSLDILANSLVSFVCAMQVYTFRKIEGHPYASTMCIGNIRSAMESLYTFFYTKEKSVLRKSLYYFCVLLTFAAGAGLGGMLTKIYGIHAIWFSCLLLIISFCIMFIKEEVEKI